MTADSTRKDAFARDVELSQLRIAALTGICPHCGDGGWWIDDEGYKTCECPAGQKQREADAKREKRA